LPPWLQTLLLRSTSQTMPQETEPRGLAVASSDSSSDTPDSGDSGNTAQPPARPEREQGCPRARLTPCYATQRSSESQAWGRPRKPGAYCSRICSTEWRGPSASHTYVQRGAWEPVTYLDLASLTHCGRRGHDRLSSGGIAPGSVLDLPGPGGREPVERLTQLRPLLAPSGSRLPGKAG